jgi:hypothetical protein
MSPLLIKVLKNYRACIRLLNLYVDFKKNRFRYWGHTDWSIRIVFLQKNTTPSTVLISLFEKTFNLHVFDSSTLIFNWAVQSPRQRIIAKVLSYQHVHVIDLNRFSRQFALRCQLSLFQPWMQFMPSIRFSSFETPVAPHAKCRWICTQKRQSKTMFKES